MRSGGERAATWPNRPWRRADVICSGRHGELKLAQTSHYPVVLLFNERWEMLRADARGGVLFWGSGPHESCASRSINVGFVLFILKSVLKLWNSVC